MKITDLKEYTDEELRAIYLQVSDLVDSPWLTTDRFATIRDYINKENPQVGNYLTRQLRIINLIKQEVFIRFVNK